MKWAQRISVAVLAVTCGAALLLPTLGIFDYAKQFRNTPNDAPSFAHPLGTDDLGRDRFSRLLFGTRVSLLLAPAAALLSTILAAVIGGVAGYAGGWVERLALVVTDLFLSLPWLFLLIAVRAALPLNVSPETSVMITFALLGSLGWAVSARVVCAGTRALRESDFVLQARASGISSWRVLGIQVLPNLKPVLFAQFWISIPVFILAEANLGILGLGVAEPLPSWGSLLRELEGYSGLSGQPLRLVPLVLLIIVVSCFQIVLSEQEVLA